MDRQAYLLHQVHPAKLAADISASVISTWLFWRGRYLEAGVSGLALPVVASALVTRAGARAFIGCMRASARVL